MADFTYTPNEARPLDLVRLLLNDVDEDEAVFSDAEILMTLTLEGDFVKLAAAQLIDTNADNEALASKVLKTQDLTTDGAKLADALHKRADRLREQHAVELEDEGFFDIIEAGPGCRAELTEYRF